MYPFEFEIVGYKLNAYTGAQLVYTRLLSYNDLYIVFDKLDRGIIHGR